MDEAPGALILLSGGLDSAVTAGVAASLGYRCHGLTFSYGQRHAVEIVRAEALARALLSIEVGTRRNALQVSVTAHALSPAARDLARRIDEIFIVDRAPDQARTTAMAVFTTVLIAGWTAIQVTLG